MEMSCRAVSLYWREQIWRITKPNACFIINIFWLFFCFFPLFYLCWPYQRRMVKPQNPIFFSNLLTMILLPPPPLLLLLYSESVCTWMRTGWCVQSDVSAHNVSCGHHSCTFCVHITPHQHVIDQSNLIFCSAVIIKWRTEICYITIWKCVDLGIKHIKNRLMAGLCPNLLGSLQQHSPDLLAILRGRERGSDQSRERKRRTKGEGKDWGKICSIMSYFWGVCGIRGVTSQTVTDCEVKIMHNCKV